MFREVKYIFGVLAVDRGGIPRSQIEIRCRGCGARGCPGGYSEKSDRTYKSGSRAAAELHYAPSKAGSVAFLRDRPTLSGARARTHSSLESGAPP